MIRAKKQYTLMMLDRLLPEEYSMKAIALNHVAVAELKITLTTRTAMAGLERLQRFVGDKRLVHRARFHPMNP